jgi:transposase
MQVMLGWSIREISRELNVSEAAVKSRLHRARQQLSNSHCDLKRSAASHYSGACKEILRLGNPVARYLWLERVSKIGSASSQALTLEVV